jgi:Leucine-rich repeat (LRR) protein
MKIEKRNKVKGKAKSIGKYTKKRKCAVDKETRNTHKNKRVSSKVGGKKDLSKITVLDLSLQNLSELPDLSDYTNLKTLYCGHNQLTHFNKLPYNLQHLRCDYNQLTHLDNLIELTPNLQGLGCGHNQLKELDNLPLNIQHLFCENNKLIQLTNLPENLKVLSCSYNKLEQLDLPETVEMLYCDHNPFIENIRETEPDFEPTIQNIRMYNEQNRMLNHTYK